MKFSLTTTDLQKTLSFVNHAISSKNQLPILSTVLLNVEKEKISFSATDLEIGIEATLPAEVIEEGSVAIPAKLFTEFISSLPQEKITVELKNTTVHIQGKKTNASIPTMNREEFPLLYEEKGEEVLRVKGDALKKDVKSVVFATSIETTRPVLSGVLFSQTQNEFLYVATDGYRLSLKKAKEQKTVDQKEISLIVPSRVVREIMSFHDTSDVVLYLSKKNNQIIFTQGNTTLVGRLIEGEFPKYQKIIPQEATTTSRFDREELQKAVKTCAIFARESANVITFQLQKEKIIVQATGENSVEIEASLTGEENEIAFNARYLIDVLANIDENDLVFEMTGPVESWGI